LAITKEEAFDPDSPAVARLREAGAVIFGKTCLPDFAHKSVTDSPRTGVTRNPYDLSRTPGGSSGGASAAVAAKIGCMALETDGGGSIRVPAAVTGIFGFKPSFGRVPHYPRGTFALLSHVGPMTRTVEDAAMMMEVICRDWCALPAASLDYVSALSEDLGRMRIAFSESLGFADATLDESVRLAIRGAVRILSDLGATVEIACPPDLQQCRETHEIFWATFSARLGRTLGSRVEVLDKGLVRLIEAGYQLPKDAFLEAVIDRTELGKRTNEFFSSYDAVIGPVFPTAAPRLTDVAALPPVMQLTSWCNQLGLPAASVYCGASAEGLPIGLQIVGRQYADDTVLIVSHAFEAAFGRAAPPSIGDVG
jgi:aspartyl-tRNA(Asn)/glutamyl-tRNA(Gln) amidotransferase subunit A